MSKEGKLFEQFDPKPAVKKNAENARDWEYSEEAKYLYGKAVLFKDRFLDPVLLTDRGRLPDPVISFDDLRNQKTLAAYTPHRNPQGLLDEITFNTVHYEDREGKVVWKFGKWAQLETLLHEQVHLWQQNFGEHPVKPGRVTHNKEFVDKCESLGLHPLPVIGAHHAVADGVFARLMEELGIPRPDDVPRAEEKPLKKDWFRSRKDSGRSTLHKWVCPDCGLSVRIGINSDPLLVHDVCSEIRGEKVFLVRHDGLEHVIYEGSDNEPEKESPEIIDEINRYFNDSPYKHPEISTVEEMAGKIGVNKKDLYDWARDDQELSGALNRFVEIQKSDPFKTDTAEDIQVSSMLLQLILVEAKERYEKK